VLVHVFDNQRAPGEGLLGPEVVQVPEQVVVERGAHPHEPFAVIDQQPDVELDAGQLGDRQPLHALAQGRAGDGQRVDAVGLTAITAGAALAGHQPGRHANDALAADEQEPLEGTGHMATVLQRPHPTVAQPPGPLQPAANPRSPTGTVVSPTSSPVLAPTAARVCERLCMSAPSTIMAFVPSTR
jgi:hypothetical protein